MRHNEAEHRLQRRSGGTLRPGATATAVTAALGADWSRLWWWWWWWCPRVHHGSWSPPVEVVVVVVVGERVEVSCCYTKEPAGSHDRRGSRGNKERRYRC